MDRFDYVVIGAGSAGCVVAARLAEDPKVKVLVIEAGGSDKSRVFRVPGMLALIYEVPQLKEKSDWGYRTTRQPHMNDRQMPWTRGKVIGGCSSVNGMLYLRGHRDNYDGWRDGGCAGWGYDDVMTYFKKAETHQDGATAFHGGEGPLQVTKQEGISVVSSAFVEAISKHMGVPVLDDFNGAVQEGASVFQMTCRNRRRSSASVAYLYPAIARGNVTLVSEATVTGINIENGIARGVSYVVKGKGKDQGQKVTVIAEREVILSAGAIGSPQILMLSGIGPADHLREKGIPVVADVPGVGENLQDHLMVPLRFLAKKNTVHRSTPGHFFAGLLNDVLFGRGWMGKTFLEGGAFIKSTPSAPRPDIQMHSIPWTYPEPNDDGPVKAVIPRQESFTMLPSLIYPKSRGEIRLSSSDPFAHPLIDPHYLEDDDDARLLLRGIELSREIAAVSPMSDLILKEATPGADKTTDESLRAHIRHCGKTVFHPVGTCKMGTDRQAVVDPSLRVHGIKNLRIADASIMPTITGGNTNAPSIMIGEKAADLIRS